MPPSTNHYYTVMERLRVLRSCPRAPFCVLVLVWVAACDEGSGSTVPSVVSHDSAGVQIITTSAPAWAPGTGWTIDDEPVLSIGLAEGEAPYLFGEISGAARFADGFIAVADRQGAEIRLFNQDGRHVRSMGRRGKGPGEFSDLSGLWRCGDGLYSYDRARRVVAKWSRALDLLDEVQVTEPGSENGPFNLICTPSGEMLLTGWGDFGAFRGRIKSGFVPHEGPLWIVDSQGQSATSLGVFEIAGRVHLVNPNTGGGGAGPYPLGPALQMAAGSTSIYVAPARELEILIFTKDGQLARIVRGPATDLDFTESMLDRYMTEGVTTEQDSTWIERMIAAGLRLPNRVPAVTGLAVAPSGYIWARRFVAPWDSAARWAVFAPGGQLLGHVGLPTEFSPLEFGVDHILGVSRDDLDIERIKLLQINRPGSN